MTTTSTCPFCERPVRVPANAVSKARVRCPLCQAEFDLAVVLNALPPELDVVEPIDAEWTSAGAKQEIVTAASPAGDEEVQAPKDSHTRPPKIEIPHVAENIQPSSRSRDNVGTTNHLRLGREILKIVLGGLVGIMIAQLVLWWLPGDLKRDPIGLAPRLSPSLAFLAPETLREPNDGSNDVQGDAPNTLPATGEPTDDQAIDQISIKPGALRGSDSGHSPSHPAAESDTATALKRTDIDPQTSLSHLFATDDVREALDDARNAYTSYSIASAETRRRQAIDLYSTLCKLAFRVTYADPAGNGMEEEVAACVRMAEAIASDKATRQLLGAWAVGWMRKDTRPNHGIVVAGKVTRIGSIEAFFKTDLAPYGRPKESLTVLSRADPTNNSRTRYDVGDEVIIFGAIVTDPPGTTYGAIQTPAIWGGLAVVIPKSK